jgi:hypothetical protein
MTNLQIIIATLLLSTPQVSFATPWQQLAENDLKKSGKSSTIITQGLSIGKTNGLVNGTTRDFKRRQV